MCFMSTIYIMLYIMLTVTVTVNTNVENKFPLHYDSLSNFMIYKNQVIIIIKIFKFGTHPSFWRPSRFTISY